MYKPEKTGKNSFTFKLQDYCLSVINQSPNTQSSSLQLPCATNPTARLSSCPASDFSVLIIAFQKLVFHSPNGRKSLFLFPLRHPYTSLSCTNSLQQPTSWDTSLETIFFSSTLAELFVCQFLCPSSLHEYILIALNEWFSNFLVSGSLDTLKMVENFKELLCYISLLILEIETIKYLLIYLKITVVYPLYVNLNNVF